MDSGELDFYQHTKVCSNTCRSTKIDLTSARVSLSSQTSTEYIPLTPASTDGTCSDSWHLCSKSFAGLKQNWCCIPNVPYDCLSATFCLAVCFYSAFSPLRCCRISHSSARRCSQCREAVLLPIAL